MILIGHLLLAIAGLLQAVVSFFIFLFIARAVLSWVSPDPSNMIVQFINSSTEPILAPIRRRIRPVGVVDFSVLIAILVLYFAQAFLVESMASYGSIFVEAAKRDAVNELSR